MFFVCLCFAVFVVKLMYNTQYIFKSPLIIFNTIILEFIDTNNVKWTHMHVVSDCCVRRDPIHTQLD